MSKKHLTEYQSILKRKQLESWSRWVDSRLMYRDLKKRNLPFKWMDEFLENSWYTMTSETFELIKKEYQVTINKLNSAL